MISTSTIQSRTPHLDTAALGKRYLVCALALNEPLIDHGLPLLTFLAADDNLLAAARSEGPTTENSNEHP